MRRKYVTVAAFISLLAIEGCKKESTPDKTVPTRTAKDLIREIKWSANGAKADLLYNADSTLKTINYTGSGSSYGVNYLYTSKRIRTIDLGNSLYKFEYLYNNVGRISNIKRLDDGENSHSQDLEFSYNINGTVAMLKYFQISEAKKKLVYTITYIYNSALELTEIASTAQNGTKFLFTIESYSDPIDFDPLWFTGTDLSENYMIYNYPVLSAMKRLPAKIKRSKITNGQMVTEQVVTISSVIKGGRLEKQNTLIKYPNRQGSDTNHETLYVY